jgi:thymidylate synthase
MRINEKGVVRASRNGPVKVFPSAMSTVYLKPQERVLFWDARDANPFFHLMEALWMLDGRRDVEWISRFSANIANYSDDGKVFNGAYGWRWRYHYGMDQLLVIADRLRRNPDDRRQVLSMWDPRQDLSHQHTKDVPCNVSACFQVDTDGRLALMVFNRSNDLIWGAHGANAVQFSVLQEVMASLTGLGVGTYTQTSFNTHIYQGHWEMAEKLAGCVPDFFSSRTVSDPYSAGEVQPYPMVQDSRTWFTDLEKFMVGGASGFSNSFFGDVAVPMREAWLSRKEGRLGDMAQHILRVEAADWRLAARDWIERRKEGAK